MMLDVFLLLLRPALMCVDAGSRKPHHIIAALIAWVLDIVLTHTTWALIAGKPRKNEWTISQTLERLCVDINNPDWPMYYGLARKINRISPTGDHIKAAIK